MTKKKNLFRAFSIFIVLASLIAMPIMTYGTPADENFNSAGMGDKGTQSYTLNGITYTTNDSGGLNITVVNDGNIASGADYALGYRSSGVGNTTLVKFKTSNGSEFKLNSFVISTGLGDTSVTVKGYRDNGEVATSGVSTSSYTTFNVSGNTDWQNIDEVRISGADLDIDIDDIDFSAAILPTYSVTYNGNGSTGGTVPTDGGTYLTADTATVLDNTGSLVRTGYTFVGWNTAANGSGTSYSAGQTFAMGSSNVTLYAKWTPVSYTVTYNGNTNTGGSVPTDGSGYNITNTVTVLGNTGSLVKTGYTFAGWNTAANGSGSTYSGGNTFAMGSSNVTLYAQWTEDTYSVTYNGNSNTGGAVPTDGTAYHTTDTATVLGNTGSLVRTGYTFAGWNTAANGSGTSYSGSDTFAIGLANVTLYAKWTPVSYTVTYNGNTNTGGSVPTDGSSYNISNTVTVLGNTGSLVKTGYTFAGWNTAANGSGSTYSGGNTFAMGSSNVTLYAQWTENTYSVTYNGNSNTGGAVPTDGTAYHTTDTATVLGNTGSLVRTGYTFAGWNTAANGSGTSYSGSDTFAIGLANVTLYAKWTPVSYTVTYNGNTNTGGSVPTDGSGYNITNTVTVLGNTGSLVKTGYTFAGWNTAANGSGSTYSGGNTFAMGSSNVTLYAQWTEDTYSVTYNGNSNTGGAVPTDGTAYHTTDTATVLGNTGSLVRTGYTFAGWNTAANGSGTSYSGGDTFAIGLANVTLYAKWTPVHYMITYSGNTNTSGTVPVDGSSYIMSATATILGNTGNLVKTGYTFTGWNTAANGSGTAYSTGSTLVMGSNPVLLYAQWTPIVVNYTLTYNGNGNTGGTVPVDSTTYHVADTATVLGNTGSLVKTGYTFAGWNTAANGSGTSYAGGNTFTMGSSNVTLYAKWTINSTSSSGGGNHSNNTSNTTNNGTTTKTSQSTAVVIVNGKEQNLGSEVKTTENGKAVITVKVDNGAIEAKIDEVVKSNTSGLNNVVEVPVASSNDEVAKVELTGDVVKKLEQNTFDVVIKYNSVKYTIPAEEFTISAVAENLGLKETELKEIKVEVQITNLDDSTIEKYNKIIESNGSELVFKPVSFEVVAKTTKTNGKTESVDINKFSNFVERTMEIPSNVDPSKITTGIVFNGDGTYSHVPTQVYQENGKWYAKLHSLTNSNYSVIWNPITVKSVEKHWAKNAVNDLASRLVITNAETFDPNKAITRADFAAYIVRALGVYREGSTHKNPFRDFGLNDERATAILIASEYGIVTGYTDGTFRPDALITREEAMVMYQRAMKIANLVGSDTNRYTNYTDFNLIGSWAAPSVKEVLAAHVFNGTSANAISPKANLTYAEAAQAIKNLLVAAKLINS